MRCAKLLSQKGWDIVKLLNQKGWDVAKLLSQKGLDVPVAKVLSQKR